MQLYVGTSGYSYKEWKGSFYPKNHPDKDMLRFYGENLPGVEINNTFYRMPGTTTLEAWAQQVPPDFRFVLKAPRKITHSSPLKQKNDEVDYLFKVSATLGEKLGAVLFQLPPYLRKNIQLLSDFTGLLPSSPRIAFEFRHPSWFDDELYELLRKKGYAVCCSDVENEEISRFVVTANWGYLRLRKANYSEEELLQWARKIKSQNWQTAYVFFKHEDEPTAPLLAKQFLEIAARSR